MKPCMKPRFGSLAGLTLQPFKLVTTVLSYSTGPRVPVTHTRRMLHSAQFEVTGTVQGVFFRKYTKAKADELGVRGWVRNTSRGTVEGVIQGSADRLETMKEWLANIGSPQSTIDGCHFSNEKTIEHYEFADFAIKKTA
ncbi:acylphosphatase-1-like [Haemaphysalis longicornis]